MSSLRALKYAIILIIPCLAWWSFQQSGLLAFTCFVFVYFVIPTSELLINPNDQNLQKAEEEMVSKDPTYDLLLYLMVPVVYLMLWNYLSVVSTVESFSFDMIGKMLAMGILCGALGINVGHELGHRSNKKEQLLAKVLLLSSLYMHFYIEHNRGHHKRVSTPNDPASGRYGEIIYMFWLRSGLMSYLSAWKIENDRVKKKYGTILTWRNEMLMFQFIQIGLLIAVYSYFGGIGLVMFLGAALIGIIQLETVNYIEHYGLTRQQRDDGTFERVQPWHSWNSNHTIGRLFLFELSRHSDHHFQASRKYPLLRHHDNSPQMPTGYPGMMLMSLIPPLWFSVMHKAIREIEASR